MKERQLLLLSQRSENYRDGNQEKKQRIDTKNKEKKFKSDNFTRSKREK